MDPESTVGDVAPDSAVESRPSRHSGGKGIWLGDYAKEDTEEVDDDIHTDGEVDRRGRGLDGDGHGEEDDDPAQTDDDDDSEDDGEIEEAERKGRDIDHGFFAALGVDDDDGHDHERRSGSEGD